MPLQNVHHKIINNAWLNKNPIDSVDGFDINRNIRKVLNKSCRFGQSFWFLAMISLFGLLVLLFILRLSSGTKFMTQLTLINLNLDEYSND